MHACKQRYQVEPFLNEAFNAWVQRRGRTLTASGLTPPSRVFGSEAMRQTAVSLLSACKFGVAWLNFMLTHRLQSPSGGVDAKWTACRARPMGLPFLGLGCGDFFDLRTWWHSDGAQNASLVCAASNDRVCHNCLIHFIPTPPAPPTWSPGTCLCEVGSAGAEGYEGRRRGRQ